MLFRLVREGGSNRHDTGAGSEMLNQMLYEGGPVGRSVRRPSGPATITAAADVADWLALIRRRRPASKFVRNQLFGGCHVTQQSQSI